MSATVQSLIDVLPKTEFASEVKELLRLAYQPQAKFGDAFARMLTKLTAARGLIFLDPLDPQLKALAAPLYAGAARSASEIAAAIANRSRDLESAGYHAQVTPSEDSFPLFLHDDTGARHALTRTPYMRPRTVVAERPRVSRSRCPRSV